MKPADEADLLNWVYEAKSELSFLAGLFFHLILKKKIKNVDSDRIGEYDMKLICIHPNTLGIPETKYKVGVMTESFFSSDTQKKK